MMMTAAATLESWKSLLLPRKEETLDTKEKLFSNRQRRQQYFQGVPGPAQGLPETEHHERGAAERLHSREPGVRIGAVD